MVKHNKTDKCYAMKVLKKEKMKVMKQIMRTANERKILALVDHPFIVKLN